jgi:hypothetical protein
LIRLRDFPEREVPPFYRRNNGRAKRQKDTRSIDEIRTEIRRMGDCLVAKILMDYQKTCEVEEVEND